jgi:hypothetical protein
VLRDQGDPATARPLLERAFAIRERVLGPDHPDHRRDQARPGGSGGGGGWIGSGRLSGCLDAARYRRPATYAPAHAQLAALRSVTVAESMGHALLETTRNCSGSGKGDSSVPWTRCGQTGDVRAGPRPRIQWPRNVLQWSEIPHTAVSV